jgi:hypothetical protein
VRLLNQSSFLGSIERTVDHRGLGAQVTKLQNLILPYYHFVQCYFSDFCCSTAHPYRDEGGWSL